MRAPPASAPRPPARPAVGKKAEGRNAKEPVLWEEEDEGGASEESDSVQVGGGEEGMEVAPASSCEQCKVSFD